MPGLKDFLGSYRNSRRVYLALWCAIGIGIIPAVIADNISPLDSFGPQFGIEISEIIYLPELVCLLVFLLGTAACIVQRRYWLLPLLLPWLALVFFDVEELAFRLPTQWDVQDQLYENQKLVRESAEPSDVNAIRDRIDRIVYTNTGLIQVDVDTLHEELHGIEEKLGEPNPDLGNNTAPIAKRIAVLTTQINQANAQIDVINKSLITVQILSRISFGLSDKTLKHKLLKSRSEVTGHRNDLISQRNAQRVELDGINRAQARTGSTYSELRDLDARVKTYLWVSQSYQSWLVSLAYKAICFGVLLILIWQFPLGSWIYLLSVAASLTVSVLYVEAPLSYRFGVVAKFVIVSMIIRVAYLVFIQNYPLLRRQSRAFLLHTLNKTLIYYLPFIALITLGVVTSIHINRLIDDQLYALEFMQGSDRNAQRRYNIDSAIDAYFEQRKKEAFVMLDDLSKQSKLTSKKVAVETVKFYEDNIKETLPEINENLAPPDCGGFLPWIFDTADCAEKAVKQPLNDSYTEARNEQRDSLSGSTRRYAKAAGGDAQKAIEFARADLSENFLAMKRVIKKQLSLLYSFIDFYTWVSLLVLIVFILKSLMYIFARIFFATFANGERVIQFEPAAEPHQCGMLQEVADTLELTSGMGTLMFVNKNYDFANAPPDEVTPQAHKAFFSRFRHGVWHMNRIETADRESKGAVPYRRIPSDERIVVWVLKPGDAIVFSWKTFVGMSDSIRIRTQYSWQLSSLVFGRMFFVVASVEADSPVDGTLLLTARGSDGIRETASPSNSPDQLLAWQTTTRFQLHANLSFRNVYRSGIQIKALDTDLAVMHLNEKRQRSGAAAFLKYFLAPV